MSQDQVGVQPEEWSSVVSNAKKGVHGIITLSKKKLVRQLFRALKNLILFKIVGTQL